MLEQPETPEIPEISENPESPENAEFGVLGLESLETTDAVELGGGDGVFAAFRGPLCRGAFVLRLFFSLRR